MPEEMLLREKESFLFADLFSSAITSGFSQRSEGNMSLSYGDTKDSLPNRNEFLAGLSINYQDIISAKQIHGSNPQYVSASQKGSGAFSFDASIADTDALVTDQKEVPLVIFSADCLVIFIYDSYTPAVGIIHAGWRGTKENIAGKTLELMEQRFNTRIAGVYLGFGPCIRQCCYEVGEEFTHFFPEGINKRNASYYLDLAAVNKKQLLNLGVEEINIFDANICTSCQHRRFFSYRKEGSACGRMISAIMLK